MTRGLLESILKEEDGHVDWLEEQLDQIAQLGVPPYLPTQTRAQFLPKTHLLTNEEPNHVREELRCRYF